MRRCNSRSPWAAVSVERPPLSSSGSRFAIFRKLVILHARIPDRFVTRPRLSQRHGARGAGRSFARCALCVLERNPLHLQDSRAANASLAPGCDCATAQCHDVLSGVKVESPVSIKYRNPCLKQGFRSNDRKAYQSGFG